MRYVIPHEVANYDPTTPCVSGDEVLSRGLLDLSACDDGTLTAVFCDNPSQPEWPHIYSLTPRIGVIRLRLRTVV